jgi:hypothetical protein
MISGNCHPVRGSTALNQLALQAFPPAMMNASVKLLALLAFETSLSNGVGYAPMSMYGATRNVPPPQPPAQPGAAGGAGSTGWAGVAGDLDGGKDGEAEADVEGRVAGQLATDDARDPGLTASTGGGAPTGPAPDLVPYSTTAQPSTTTATPAATVHRVPDGRFTPNRRTTTPMLLYP